MLKSDPWILVLSQLISVVELRGGLRGPGPPKRPGGPLETPGLRGYKGPLKGPLENNPPSSIQITQHNIFVYRVL